MEAAFLCLARPIGLNVICRSIMEATKNLPIPRHPLLQATESPTPSPFPRGVPGRQFADGACDVVHVPRWLWTPRPEGRFPNAEMKYDGPRARGSLVLVIAHNIETATARAQRLRVVARFSTLDDAINGYFKALATTSHQSISGSENQIRRLLC